MTDRTRIMGLGEKLSNANTTIYIAILIWWIVCLWRDDPGSPRTVETASAGEARQIAIEPETDGAIEPAREAE